MGCLSLAFLCFHAFVECHGSCQNASILRSNAVKGNENFRLFIGSKNESRPVVIKAHVREVVERFRCFTDLAFEVMAASSFIGLRVNSEVKIRRQGPKVRGQLLCQRFQGRCGDTVKFSGGALCLLQFSNPRLLPRGEGVARGDNDLPQSLCFLNLACHPQHLHECSSLNCTEGFDQRAKIPRIRLLQTGNIAIPILVVD